MFVIQGVAECRYGDKDTSFCRADMDCSLSVVRELCCNTCKDYAIPNVVQGGSSVYKLIYMYIIHV